MAVRYHYYKIGGLLLLAYTALQVYCINQLSPGYDESSFATYGSTILKFQPQKDVIRYDSKLPITALNMLPRAFEQLFNPGLKKTEEAYKDVIRGRYISLLVSLLLALLIFRWAKELYNDKTALQCLFLYLLCPNFLAHGILVSSDIFACFFMTLVFYSLWRYQKEKKTKYFFNVSWATGLALISKFSMLYLVILVPLVSLLGWAAARGKRDRFNGKKFLFLSLLFVLTCWFLINASHFFYQTFLPLNNYQFRSTLFIHVQQLFQGINPPLPLPSSYISSMDMVLYAEELGGGKNGSLNGTPYLLGHYNAHGFWYYYFIVMFFKWPIPVLMIIPGALLLLFFRFNKAKFIANEMYLLIPALFYLVYLNFFYSTQIGIRHILIIFPLLYIFSGRLISRMTEGKKRYLLYALLAFQAISVFRYFPHILPYTNEFIRDKKMAYKKIADTNLCYGEGQKYLWRYLEKNKDAALMPEKPVSGKVVMEVNEMLNLNVRTAGKYEWIWSLTPQDHIHSQYLVFNVNRLFVDSLQRNKPDLENDE